jgi:deoxyhypusine synthase
MDRAGYLATTLETLNVSPRPIAELLEAMRNTGFQGKSLARVLDVWLRMIRQPDNTIFFGYSGSLSTTGQWKIVKWLIENRYIDVLVSTGANVSEDLLEALGYSYYQGSHSADDNVLFENQIDRFYDVYADERHYQRMERFILEFMMTLDSSKVYSSADFLHEFGKYQDERSIDSLAAAAYRSGVPIFSPAMADSAYGVAAYLLYREQRKHVIVDQFRDFEQLGDIGLRSNDTSVIYIGGGVPKDTIQLVAVMTLLARSGEPRPHKYAVQITTDSPQWGGLSGCTFEEAVSWGKIDPAADRRAVCYCDATIALPILSHALAERELSARTPVNLAWLFQSDQRR